ncbi:restriction endonuclease subunit S [Cellulomonas sp. P24]|uniref:restriction endonuclease subunit S n=1 Tax=Cellulomonas sp. P24 TaxID=2885206 RepID=UPI00216B3A97|nr:restriction endonuclease subunit S [Cellulomonas sp. P24]MCR6492718.1 restriction endonuclease subunit S [Cellulomonas sp. P24]
MADSAETTLGALVELTPGFPFASAGFTAEPDDIRLVRGDNVAQGSLRWANAARWPRTEPVDPKYHLQVGDVVLAMDRPWIEAGLKYAELRSVDVPSYLVQRVARLRAKPGTDQRYIAHIVGSRAFTEYVLAIQTGSAVPHISGPQIASFVLTPHSLEEQRAIAEVLGALDDKIAANTRAERLADDLIRQMHARAVAAPGSGNDRLLEAFTFSFGEPFSGEQFSEPGVGRPLIRIRDLRTFESQVWTTESRTRETVVRPGEIVVGMDAEFRATAWLGEPGLLNQRVCRVTSRVAGAAFVREALREPLAEIEGYKSGTTVIHLNKGDLDRHTVVIPSAPALQAFEATAEPVFARRVASAAERRGIAAIRDTLLPALMSGKLRVRDAERLAEAHT